MLLSGSFHVNLEKVTGGVEVIKSFWLHVSTQLLYSQVGKREEDIQAKVQLMYEKER